MVERFESAAIIAGAILLEYLQLSIEQIVQMLETGLPAFIRNHAAQKIHPTLKHGLPKFETATVRH